MLNSSSRSTLSLMIKPATYIDSLVYFHSLEWYNVSIHISSQWSFRVIDYCLIFYQFTTYLIDKQMPLLYFYLHWIEVSYFIKILYDFSLFSGKIKKYLNKIQVLYATRISLGSGGCHSEGCYSTEGFLAPRTTTLRIFFFFFSFCNSHLFGKKEWIVESRCRTRRDRFVWGQFSKTTHWKRLTNGAIGKVTSVSKGKTTLRLAFLKFVHLAKLSSRRLGLFR